MHGELPWLAACHTWDSCSRHRDRCIMPSGESLPVMMCTIFLQPPAGHHRSQVAAVCWCWALLGCCMTPGWTRRTTAGSATLSSAGCARYATTVPLCVSRATQVDPPRKHALLRLLLGRVATATACCCLMCSWPLLNVADAGFQGDAAPRRRAGPRRCQRHHAAARH